MNVQSVIEKDSMVEVSVADITDPFPLFRLMYSAMRERDAEDIDEEREMSEDEIVRVCLAFVISASGVIVIPERVTDPEYALMSGHVIVSEWFRVK